MTPSVPAVPGLVLMYHRVATLIPDVHRLCISPAVFRSHMLKLRRRCRPTSLVALVTGTDAADTRRPVAVTFDDGCLDNLTTASPILQELEVPATFFVPTERLGERHEFWWDTLERIFMADHNLPAQLDLHREGYGVYLTATSRQRAATHDLLVAKIRAADVRTRHAMIDRITAWCGLDLPPRDTHRCMLDSEIIELSRRPGHEIGAHTVHHLSLPAHNRETQRCEILQSREALQSLIGGRVSALAYPYGHYDDVTLSIAGDAFAVAVIASPKAVGPTVSPLAVPRLDASQLTVDDLAAVLASG